MKTNNTYPKSEKLKSKKEIDALFSHGKAMNKFPIRAVYIKNLAAEKGAIKVGVAVAKKNIKLAVQRNLIKRRMREAYRLNQHELKTTLQENEATLDVMLLYTAKEILPYATIERQIKAVLRQLSQLK